MKELADVIVAEAEATKIVWQIDGGVCVGENLWTSPPGDDDLHPGGGVIKSEMKKGTSFPPHVQEYCTEWLIVIGGLAEVVTYDIDGETPICSVLLGPGEGARIAPGQLHQCSAREDTQILGVTVPRDRGYPDACADPCEL